MGLDNQHIYVRCVFLDWICTIYVILASNNFWRARVISVCALVGIGLPLQEQEYTFETDSELLRITSYCCGEVLVKHKYLIV